METTKSVLLALASMTGERSRYATHCVCLDPARGRAMATTVHAMVCVPVTRDAGAVGESDGAPPALVSAKDAKVLAATGKGKRGRVSVTSDGNGKLRGHSPEKGGGKVEVARVDHVFPDVDGLRKAAAAKRWPKEPAAVMDPLALGTALLALARCGAQAVSLWIPDHDGPIGIAGGEFGDALVTRVDGDVEPLTWLGPAGAEMAAPAGIVADDLLPDAVPDDPADSEPEAAVKPRKGRRGRKVAAYVPEAAVNGYLDRQADRAVAEAEPVAELAEADVVPEFEPEPAPVIEVKVCDPPAVATLEPVKSNGHYRLEQHRHAKKGWEYWIAVPSARMPRAEWEAELTRAKGLGGWYGRQWQDVPGGYCFKAREAAVQFSRDAA